MQKPVISQRFSPNGHTRWVLSTTTEDASYDLVVQHDYLEDVTVRFERWIDGDCFEMLTRAALAERRSAIVEHEGCGHCARCQNPEGASTEVLSTREWLCDDCVVQFAPNLQTRPLSLVDAVNRADAILDAQLVGEMSAREAELRAELQRHWDAFALLFNPTTTL